MMIWLFRIWLKWVDFKAVSGLIDKEGQDQSSEAESQNANSGPEDGKFI